MTRGATRGSVLTTWRFWVRSTRPSLRAPAPGVKRRAAPWLARRGRLPEDARRGCDRSHRRRARALQGLWCTPGRERRLLRARPRPLPGPPRAERGRQDDHHPHGHLLHRAERRCPRRPGSVDHATIKAGLGIVQQDESLDPDLSVEQNLIVYASYFGIARRDAAARAEA